MPSQLWGIKLYRMITVLTSRKQNVVLNSRNKMLHEKTVIEHGQMLFLHLPLVK
jgi:hypothetical protein